MSTPRDRACATLCRHLLEAHGLHPAIEPENCANLKADVAIIVDDIIEAAVNEATTRLDIAIGKALLANRSGE